MSEDLIRSAWQTLMNSALSNIELKLREHSIPTIRGKIHGAGHTLIDTGLSALDEHTQLIRAEGSLAVLDVERKSSKSDGADDIASIQLYVRLGKSNAWLYTSVSTVTDSDESDDFDDEFEEPEVESELLSRMALVVARSESFGGLKNKRQRLDLTLSLINKHTEYAIPEFYAGEVAQRAEGIFELGLLPERVMAMQTSGKEAAEISKILGISKQKIERAANASIPEHVAELLKRDSGNA